MPITSTADFTIAAQGRTDEHLDDIIDQNAHILAATLGLSEKPAEDADVVETLSELLACTEEKRRRAARRKRRSA